MSCLVQTLNVISSLDCSKYTLTNERLVSWPSIGIITNQQSSSNISPIWCPSLAGCLDQLFPSGDTLAVEPNLLLLFHFLFQLIVSLLIDILCLLCSVSNIPSSLFLFPQPPFSLFSCFREAMSSFSYLFGTDALVNSSYFPSHHSSLPPPFTATYNQLHVMDSKVYIH